MKSNKDATGIESTLESFFKRGKINLNQENRNVYDLALDFINRFHHLLNIKLNELCNTCNGFVEKTFTFPEIPNYTSLLLLITNIFNHSEKNLDSLSTEKTYSVVEILPKNKIIPTAKTQSSVSNDFNLLEYKKQPKKIVQNRTANVLAKNSSPKVTSKFDKCKPKLQADNNLKAKTNSSKIISVSSKNKTVDADTQVENVDLRQTRQLVQASFHIVNISPFLNLINYSQNKEKLEASNNYKHFATNSNALDKSYPSYTVRPTTPKKVKQMFDMVSAENTFPKPPKQQFVYQIYRNQQQNSSDDSDSTIFDDDEFERNSISAKYINKIQEPKPCIVNNPFHLNKHELMHVKEETLNALGLFTDQGDIKPEIISMLDARKNIKTNDARNKQFRSKRQWDFQIHVQPKSDFDDGMLTAPSDVLSYSSDLKIKLNNVNKEYTVS